MTLGVKAVVEVLLRMDAQIEVLTARVARQDERIAQLERQLNRSSRNSSIPCGVHLFDRAWFSGGEVLVDEAAEPVVSADRGR